MAQPWDFLEGDFRTHGSVGDTALESVSARQVVLSNGVLVEEQTPSDDVLFVQTRFELSTSATLIAGVLTLNLALLRWIAEPQGKVWLALLVGALGFLALIPVAKRHRRAATGFPVLGLAAVAAVALLDDGLRSEAMPWLPLAPFVAALIGSRRMAQVFTAATLLITIALALWTVHESAEPLMRTCLRVGGIMGAIAFAYLLAHVFQGERDNAVHQARTTAARFSRIASTVDEIIFVYDVHAARFTYLSPAGVARLGIDVGNLPQQAATTIGAAVDFAALHAQFSSLAVGERGHAEHQLVHADGDKRTYASVFVRASAREVMGTARDTTDSARLADALRRATQRLSAVLGNFSDGIAITDDTGTLVMINDPLRHTFGIPESADSLIGMDTWRVISSGKNPPKDLVAFKKGVITRARARVPAQHDEIEMADGRVFDRTFVPLLLDGQHNGHLWSYHDVSHRSQAERASLLKAESDGLTGLLNRTGFYERCKAAIARQQKLTVLFFDLDGFKQVNDTAGHAAGDAVLCEVAARMSRIVREQDALGRLGGDEFAVMLPGVTQRAVAERIAVAVLDSLQTPITFEGRSFRVGASVGVAGYPEAAPALDELITAADAAMYEAKRAGKNCFRHAR